jgi:hypothetical protein
MLGFSSKTLLIAVVPFLLGVTGCTLPPIARDRVVAENTEISGTAVPLPLVDAPVPLGGTCNLPSEEDLQAMIRAEVPSFLADWVTLESAELESVTFSTAAGSAGNFSTLNEMTLDIVFFNANEVAIDRFTLSSAMNPDGFGERLVLGIAPPADLLAILREAPDCAGVAVTVSGSTPSEDITFDVSVRVRATVRLSP